MILNEIGGMKSWFSSVEILTLLRIRQICNFSLYPLRINLQHNGVENP